MKIGRAAQKIADFKSAGFLPFQPIRIQRIEQRNRVFVGKFQDDAQRVVEVALDRQNLRALNQSLRQLSQGDGVLRQQHDAADSRDRAIRRRRRGGVAGARANRDARAVFGGFGNRHRHAAIFETAGRVGALEFQIKLAVGRDFGG